MACSISGEIATDPVVSLKSGHLFERRLIEKQINATGRCPITDQDLTKEDLLSVKTHTNQKATGIKPRLTATAGIPGMIKSFQDEWDAVMLETYTLKKHLFDVRQELAYALYQKDAASRVIARLIKERDQARAALSDVQSNMAAAVGKSGGTAMEEEDDAGISQAIIQKMVKTQKKLSKARKPKVKGLQLSVAPSDKLASYEVLSSHPLHSSSRPGIMCLDVHPKNQEFIMTGGADHNAIIFNRSTKKIVDTLKYHKKKITSVLFHPSQNVVFTTSSDNTGAIWTPDAKSKYQVGSVLKEHTGDVVGSTLHPSGDYLVTGSADSSWCFWDIESSACKAKVATPEHGGYSKVTFHPDGLILAAASADKAVRIFDVKTQKNVANVEDHNATITGLAFSENGYYLGSADTSGVVKMWDLRKLKNFHTIELGHALHDLTFDLSGTYMLTAGKDIQVYNVKGFSLVKTFSDHKKDVTGARFAKDAAFIASTSKDRNLKIFGK
mmetsp:Transcript_24199/g.33557  ORF Transcript_24199/g.33557 Transcript_24199/m.33557 type:complete len:497 (-) Transcript_24199:171-1661(-)|eukprot:jgi/Bigna1/89621/estExt_fgenesh1_pg.C_520119